MPLGIQAGQPVAAANWPYRSPAVAAGGTPPYTFAITAGSLPPGLTLNAATGVISGTPTVAANYPFTITVTDAMTDTASASTAILVVLFNPPPLVTTPPVAIDKTNFPDIDGSSRFAPLLRNGNLYILTSGAAAGIGAGEPQFYKSTDGGHTWATWGTTSGYSSDDQGGQSIYWTPTSATATVSYVNDLGGDVGGLSLQDFDLDTGVWGSKYGTSNQPNQFGTFIVRRSNGHVVAISCDGGFGGTPGISWSTCVPATAAWATIDQSIDATASFEMDIQLDSSDNVHFIYVDGTIGDPGQLMYCNLSAANSVGSPFTFTGVDQLELSRLAATLSIVNTMMFVGLVPGQGSASPFNDPLQAIIWTGPVSLTPSWAHLTAFTLSAQTGAIGFSTCAVANINGAPVAIISTQYYTGGPFPPPGNVYYSVYASGAWGPAVLYWSSLTDPMADSNFNYLAIDAFAVPIHTTTNGTGMGVMVAVFGQIISTLDLVVTPYYLIDTAPPIVPVPLFPVCPIANAAQVGVPYASPVTVTGGTPPYTYALTGGALPPGLSLNTSTGVISGTPTTSGMYSWTVTVTDSAGNTAIVTCGTNVGINPVVPCTNAIPGHFTVSKVMAAFKPATHVPVRGAGQ